MDTWQPDAWETYLKDLPTAPWNMYTDYPRQATSEANAHLQSLATVPLQLRVTDDDISLLVAFCAALCSCDHGRDVIWVLDSTAGGEPLPLCANLQNCRLLTLKEELAAERLRLKGMRRAAGVAEAIMVLRRAAPPGRFAAQGAHPVCQVAFGKEPAGEPPPDFVLRCSGVNEQVSLGYRADLYDEATAASLAGHIAALHNLQTSWASLDLGTLQKALLQEEERSTVLKFSYGPVTGVEGIPYVHELFERLAKGESAESTAVIPSDDAVPMWSYRRLDAAAGEISLALAGLGLNKAGGRVALMMQRSPAMVAAIYGILRAGQAYVPLDAGWPVQRQSTVIQDVDASALVSSQEYQVPASCRNVPSLRLSADGRPQASSNFVPACVMLPLPRPEPHMPVYILYTSGTTGKPKGVNVPHVGLAGRTAWLQRTWPLGASDTVPQKTPITFAISEWELFWPLCYGARLALADHALHGDPQHISWLLETRRVTHGVFVPSMLDQLLEELDGKTLPALNCLICCGEALRPATISRASAGLPSAEIVNLYGPTEGCMTMLRYGNPLADKDLLRFPIGVPIDNTQVLCTCGPPPELDLSPLLVKGEIGFAGPMIATGYWGLPELTAEKFVNNPYATGRIYRTGDLGRLRADGSLEFLGRVDLQIKFNGVRIELGEIESVLQSLPGVTSASAFLAPPHLVAACALANMDAQSAEAEQSLLDELRQRLPKHTVPTRLLVLRELPLTDRSKVDRRKLLEEFELQEEERKKHLSSTLAGPLTGTARRIEEIVQDMLNVSEALPATASFQQLGFSSLLLGRLTTRVRRVFDLPGLPATAVYQHPTLGQLAAHIDESTDTESESSLPVVRASQVWHGKSSTSRLSLFCTCLGMFFQCVIQEFAFLPAYYVLWYIYGEYSTFVLLASIIPILLFDVIVTILVYIVMKWAIIGQRRAGNYPVFGWYYWKWWFMHSMDHYIESHLTPYIVDTVLYSVFLRLLGAQIGKDVRVNFAHLSDVDLIRLDDNVRVERDATLYPARLWCGMLQLQPIHICKGSYVSHRAFVAGGFVLPESMELSPMASMDKHGAYHVVPCRNATPRSSRRLDFLQLFLGAPLLMIVEGLADIPVFFALKGFWAFLVKVMVVPEHLHSQSALSVHLGAEGNTPKLHKHRRRRWGWSFIAGSQEGYTLEAMQRVLYPYLLSIPWIMTFVHGFAHFFLVVAVKRLIVGRFYEGPVSGDWDRFRRWLLERLLTSNSFHDFMELWVNTEVLSCWYRLLGATVAPRVNADFFGGVEFDLIQIERDVVFGSSVLLINNAHGASESIVLRREACVLDNSCVLPGTTVPEGALLGSFTVVPPGQELEAMTVYTGCENGACVRLFQRPLLPGEKVVGQHVVREELPSPARRIGRAVVGEGNANTAPAIALPAAAIKQRELEALALKRHRTDFWFVLFNLWCIASAALFAPLPAAVYWATIIIDFEVYDFFRDSDMGEVFSVVLIPLIYFGVTGVMLAVMVALKWVLIGKWTAGDRPYYTWFHFRWSALMGAFTSLSDLEAQIAGTWFAVALMRLMGAKVGKRVCFFGHGFEYDLLHIGDEVCIGPDCDVTAHTVENMVMKMEVVKFESGCTCMAGSVVMPGGQMEPWSTLIEHSQVLKGETVPQGCCFGGLPAKLRPGYPLPQQDKVLADTGNDDTGQEPLLGGSVAGPAKSYQQQGWERGREMRPRGTGQREEAGAGDMEFLEYHTDNESDLESQGPGGWLQRLSWRARARRLLRFAVRL